MPGWRRAEAEKYIKHVARKNGIRIRWLKGRDWILRAECYESARMVFIPHPNNARQFLVAMHEMGHLLGELTSAMRSDFDFTPGTWWLMLESAAWAWAVEHVPTDLAEAMDPIHFARTVGTGMWSHAWDVAGRAEGR